MANEPVLTVIGNLTADPELRATQSGHSVANFTVASTPRTFNRQTNEWEDGEALFLRCSAWRDLAEHIAASLAKGMRVVVQGNLHQRSYTDKEGNSRTSIELDVQEIGPSLRYATAQVTRAQQGGGQNRPQQAVQQGQGAPQGYGPPQGAPGGYPAPQQGYPAPQQGAPQQQGYSQQVAPAQAAPQQGFQPPQTTEDWAAQAANNAGWNGPI